MSRLTLGSDSISLPAEMGRFLDAIIPGDSREVLGKIPLESVDLVVTSPPDAGRRYEGREARSLFLPIPIETKTS